MQRIMIIFNGFKKCLKNERGSRTRNELSAQTPPNEMIFFTPKIFMALVIGPRRRDEACFFENKTTAAVS